MSEEPEIEIDWEKRFPKMSPMNGVPSLSTINGCGLSLYGGRDHDPITGTYVKTHVFVMVFIPIFFLKAFRVADAESGGWYFIGREPLSGFARGWNKLLFITLFAVIGGSMWNAHNNTTEKVAQRTLAEAQSVQAAGDILAAAKTYKSLLDGPLSVAATAALNQIVEVDLPSQSPANQARLLDFFVRNERSPQCQLGHDYFSIGLGYAESARESDLDAAYKMLHAIGSLAENVEDPSAYHNAYEAVLSARIAAEPDDLELLSEYAGILELRDAEGDHAKLIALLEPRRESLGTTEGARILGQHDADQGNLDTALQLLRPYTEARLDAYHQAEASYEQATENAWERGMKELEKGKAGPGWYRKYEAASEDAQGMMVQEWIANYLEKNSGLIGHRERFIEAASVVPHAMDLGILLLQHAQGLEDADARLAELESSEAIFMTVQGAAGDNPQYQLFLGQVKYWLGKSDEGEALFTQFLSSGDPENPAFHAMLAVASTYREVGEMGKARALYEDVYSRASEEDVKQSAANMRAITATDTEDAIRWLKRCKQDSPNVRANLAANMGHVAVQEGNLDEAATQYRAAIAIYNDMPESPVVLNNSALVYSNLFDVSGDVESHDQALVRLRKAHNLNPEDSITMGNFATHLDASAVLAVTRDAIDYVTLREEPSSGLMSAIATDRAGRLALQKQLVESARFREAATYFGKTRILSPKSMSVYARLSYVHKLREDAPALSQLLDDFLAAELDQQKMAAEYLDIFAGNQDEERLAKAQQELANLQSRVAALGETTPETAALLHIYVADHVTGLWSYDQSTDANLAIQAAEKAISIHSSQNARRTLATAYFLRCAATLAKSKAKFAESAQSLRNVLASTYLLATALNSDDADLRAAILADPDFKKGLALCKVEALADKDYQKPWLWALARHADAEFASVIAEQVKADKVSRVSREITYAMAPLSGSTILALSWASEIAGDGEAAKEIRAQAKAAGVPLP
jgi:hypothetical protein